MAAKVFYEKELGPRRSPPPKPTPFVEITSAVPDLSLISNCQPSERQKKENPRHVNQNPIQQYESTNRISTNVNVDRCSPTILPSTKNLDEAQSYEYRPPNHVTSTNADVGRSSPSYLPRPKKLDEIQSYEYRPQNHSRTTDVNVDRNSPTCLPRTEDLDEPQSNTYRATVDYLPNRTTPIPQSNKSDNIENYGSYRTWRAKNADLFTKPENDDRIAQASNYHDKRNGYASMPNNEPSIPNKSVATRYNQYFRTQPECQEFYENKHHNIKKDGNIQQDAYCNQRSESHNNWKYNASSPTDRQRNKLDKRVSEHNREPHESKLRLSNNQLHQDHISQNRNEIDCHYRRSESGSIKPVGVCKEDDINKLTSRYSPTNRNDKRIGNVESRVYSENGQPYDMASQVSENRESPHGKRYPNTNGRMRLHSENFERKMYQEHPEKREYLKSGQRYVHDYKYTDEPDTELNPPASRRNMKCYPRYKNEVLPRNEVVRYDKEFNYSDDEAENGNCSKVKRNKSLGKTHSSPLKSTKKPCRCVKCNDQRIIPQSKRLSLIKYKKDRRHQGSCSCCHNDISDSDSSMDSLCCRDKHKGKKKKISVDDLYHIVRLQNEQISLLQKQVERLIENNSKSPEKEHCSSKKIKRTPSTPQKPTVTQTSKPFCSCHKDNVNDNKLNDKFSAQGFTLSVVRENSQIECQGLENHNGVSIGVMTSFVEIMQKAQIGQKNMNCQNNDFRRESISNTDHLQDLPQLKEDCKLKKKGMKNCKGQIENSLSKRDIPTVVEESFTLNERDLPVVPEHTPSPECSVHIDIHDYGSSSSSASSSSSSSEDESGANGDGNINTDSEDPKVGWTLYDNVVGQVNNILQRGAIPKPNPPSIPSAEDVRKATMERLRMLGVNFGEMENLPSKKVTFGEEFYPQIDLGKQMENLNLNSGNNEESLHIGELAKKYLNQDPNSNVAVNKANRKDVAMYNIGNGNANLSFATLRYLERYHILPGANKGKQQVDAEYPVLPIVRDIPKPNPPPLNLHQSPQHNFPSTKILDITALKQQPKLL